MEISSGNMRVQTGLATGLDTGSLIQQLVQAESGPLNALNTRKTTLNNKISALGRFSRETVETK